MADIITCKYGLVSQPEQPLVKKLFLDSQDYQYCVDVDTSNKVLNVDITISTETLCPGQGPVSCWKLN